MRTILVEWNEYSVEVTEANALQGMRRTLLSMDGQKARQDTDDRAMQILREMTYPDLMAVVKHDTVQGLEWPVTFSEFINLPEQLVSKWERAVYELNPHWINAGDSEAEEKKQPSQP